MARRRIPGDPLVAVAYVRVSTEDQQLGPEAQRAAIGAWAARAGVRVASWHVDQGVSGGAPPEQRPGLLEALSALREHKAGLLIAAKRDRLARDVVIAGLLAGEVSRVGAVIRTADGVSDLEGAGGEMMRGVVDVFAAYERAMIRERTKAALGAKKRRGERVGCLPFGWCAGEDGKTLREDAAEQRTIAAVLGMRANGLTERAITNRLEEEGYLSRARKPLSRTQVHRILAAQEARDAARR